MPIDSNQRKSPGQLSDNGEKDPITGQYYPPSKSYSKPKILNKIDRAMQNKEDNTPVADDGAQKNRFDPSKNLGKFLHPKKSNTVPANKANGTIDANTGNGRSSQTQ